MIGLNRLLTVLCFVAIPSAVAQADVLLFGDFEEWEAAVGPFTTIDFTGFPEGTEIDNQYADSGVVFPGSFDQISFSSSFPNDGVGLQNVGGEILLVFETPQLWLGTDFPGLTQYALFLEDRLIYESPPLGFGPPASASVPGAAFVGLLSDTLFDSAIISAPGAGNAAMDDLYFGVPSPAAFWLFAGAWLLGNRRRRR